MRSHFRKISENSVVKSPRVAPMALRYKAACFSSRFASSGALKRNSLVYGGRQKRKLLNTRMFTKLVEINLKSVKFRSAQL